MVKHMTILNPLNAPNTDGIDPGTTADFYNMECCTCSVRARVVLFLAFLDPCHG